MDFLDLKFNKIMRTWLTAYCVQVIEGLSNPLVMGSVKGKVITPIPDTKLQLLPGDTPPSVGKPTKWRYVLVYY